MIVDPAEEALMSQAALPEPLVLDDPNGVLANPDVLYEVVDGKVVDLPSMGVYSHFVALNLYNALVGYLAQAQIGLAVHEVVFVLESNRRLCRRPDVAFVSFERWPAAQEVPDEGEWEVVPDLAIEVVSPNDRGEELLRKIRNYFECGVRLVWVLYPTLRQVYVYTSPTDVRILEASDQLDGSEVLPGLRLLVEPLFRRTLG